MLCLVNGRVASTAPAGVLLVHMSQEGFPVLLIMLGLPSLDGFLVVLTILPMLSQDGFLVLLISLNLILSVVFSLGKPRVSLILVDAGLGLYVVLLSGVQLLPVLTGEVLYQDYLSLRVLLEDEG